MRALQVFVLILRFELEAFANSWTWRRAGRTAEKEEDGGR